MSEKIKTFEETFNKFISKRVDDLDPIILNDRKYTESTIEINSNYEKILMALEENNHVKLLEYLDQYTSAMNYEGGIISEIMYFQGLKDGFRLLRILNRKDTI